MAMDGGGVVVGRERVVRGWWVANAMQRNGLKEVMHRSYHYQRHKVQLTTHWPWLLMMIPVLCARQQAPLTPSQVKGRSIELTISSKAHHPLLF